MSASAKVDSQVREILATAKRVDILTRQNSTESLAGSYHSAFKGSGIEFDEVREYIPGDDVRSIDWNVTAKSGIPHIKRYREEREQTVILAIDVSASVDFGSTQKTKRRLAAEVAATLATSAVMNNDKVGLMLFADEPLHFVPPRAGLNHLARLLRDTLVTERPGKGTDLATALRHLNRVCGRHAIVFLFSDFIFRADETEEAFKMLGLTGRRHDLVAIQVTDPREEELPSVGRLSLEDPETGRVLMVNTSDPKFRQRFKEDRNIRQEDLKRGFARSGVDNLIVSTREPFDKALRGFFKQRSQRR